MKKEVVLAIFIGFAVGLAITFGIWTANKSLRQVAANITPTPAPTSAPAQTTPTPTISAIPLSISTPTDELLTTDKTITITGKTTPSAAVVILTETEEFITSAASSGSFSQKISLEGGYNRLTITAFDATGASATTNLLITYITSKI